MTCLRLRTLHSSFLGRIEDFSAPGDCPAPRGHSPEYQLVLPYAGAFEWHVGAKGAFLDFDLKKLEAVLVSLRMIPSRESPIWTRADQETKGRL